ncbi:hypothetical protein PVAND_003755 [Polypedilum vanderplanki]|uniref:DNA-directed RNA polymerase III subunit n=1 Tax=Polypedilum vanderplanki TaxID=319348 RepID=A0A9J6BV07_POLVA|nr:hypothetical protein PVAND_003755 [Polypedilum vanderplanki]
MYQYRNSSFTKEQLTNLGITKEMNTSQQFNRPLFPLLQNKPIEIEKNNKAMDYKVLFKEDFRSRLFEIHNTASSAKKGTEMDNYSLQIAAALEKEHKKNLKFTIARKMMPAELNYQSNPKKRKDIAPALKSSKKRIIDVEKRLEVLEKKEANEKEEDEESEKPNNDSDAEAENQEDIEDPELDDETDYHNNYFDNGDNFYADEDDALDDGPIY